MAATPNNLVVKITAVDAASSAIDAVARKLGGLTAPAQKVGKSLARLSDASGVTRLSKAITHLGGSTAKAGIRMTEALAPLGILTGALSAAGAGKMISDWARMSQALSFDATRIGAGISQLNALEGSARLSGSSAAAAAGGLRTLQDTMTDTVGGRNMEALLYFRQLGVAFDDGAGHALRATDVLPKLADRLKTISDRSLRARVGTALLGGAYEELAPWIDRGSAGMAEYADVARKYGVQTEESVRAAGIFRESQTELTFAFEGLGNSISEKVSPPLSELMKFLAGLIGNNRTMISDKFGQWAGQFATWLKSVDWDGVAAKFSDLYDKFIAFTQAVSKWHPPAWMRIAFGFPDDSASGSAGTSAGPSNYRGGAQDLSSIYADDAKPFDKVRDDRAKQMMAFFEGQGWTHAQAAGIVANLDRESGMSPNAQGDRDKSGNFQSYGLGQWHADRQAKFREWAGHDIKGSTLDEQMRFVQYELTHGEKSAGDILRTAQNPSEAAYAVNAYYERPRDVAGEASIRGPAAERYASMPAGKVQVDVNVHGLPAGASATTTTSGDTNAGVKISRAMPQ